MKIRWVVPGLFALWGMTQSVLADLSATFIPSAGPFAGGNRVLITNTTASIGNGVDITNITVGGVTATGFAASQGTTWVSFLIPATGSAGAKDVVIQSESIGTTTLTGQYTVNPAGQIGKMTYGAGTWTNLDRGMNNAINALAVVGTNLYAGGVFTSAGRISANDIAKWSLVESSYGSVDFATSFQEPTLHTNLHLDIPNPSVGTIRPDTVNHNLLFPGPGADMWSSRNGIPFAWAAIPQLGSGGVWRAETEVKYTVSSHTYGRIAGLTIYPGPDGSGGASDGQEFTFGLDQWDGPNGAWVQGLGDNRPGDSGNLYSSLVTDVLDLRMDVTVGATNYNTYNFYFKLPSNETWSTLGTIRYSGTADRVALFFKCSGPTTNVSFNYFNVTTLVYKACSNWLWTGLSSGMNSSISALAQDGTNLYAGGSFTNAGGVAASYIARWDGSAWTNLGSGMNGSVSALAFDGTNLYAGGSFTTAGGVAANYIARWDGSAWTNLGSGMNGAVSALAYDGTNLYAGGSFTTAGGAAANYIARWDGSAWTSLGSGMNGSVSALAMAGNSLFAGGSFTTAGGLEARYISKWDGSGWMPLGSGMNGTVSALTFAGNSLFAGGSFTTAGGYSASRMARWDGSVWTNLGSSGMNGTVSTLAYDGGNIYAGGAFTTAGGYSASRAAKWIPSFVETVGVEPRSGSVTGGYQVVISGQGLGNGADITNVTLCGVTAASIVSQSSTQVVIVAGSSGPIGLGDVRVYSESSGETVRSNAFTYTRADIAISGPAFPSVFRGRSVTSIFTVTNSGNATLMITGVTNNGAGASYFDVSALNGMVIAAGAARNFPVVFTPLETGTFTPVSYTINNSLTSNYSFALSGACFDLSATAGPCAGGNMITITNGLDFGTITNVLVGGVSASIAGSGANWVTITLPAAGSTGTVDVVIQTGDHGDTTLSGIYSYNPAGQIGSDSRDVWMDLNSGMNSYVYALKSDTNGALYAGGEFSMAGGEWAGYIAKWNPATAAWTPLGDGVDSSVYSLATGPDGSLYAGGSFYTAGGVSVNNIARWNPSTEEWSAMGDWWDAPPSALVCSTNGTLYAGGYFNWAGGAYANYLAKWDPGTETWSALSEWLDNGVQALVIDTNGNLYAGGWFSWAGGVPANYVAKWDPGTETWSALGDGLDSGVSALALDSSGNLYAGGWFTTAGGVPANYVAKWDPGTQTWSALGGGFDNVPNALKCDTNGNLYAGGYFTAADGATANYVAKWNGTTWTNMAGGMNNAVAALEVSAAGDIYAGGYFDTADGQTVNYMSQWIQMPASIGVSPVSGSCTGGYPVVITGVNLGSGSDVTDVKLCGVSVASITSQSSTQIVVVAGAGTAGLGDVQVNSASFGLTIKSNTFTYLKDDQTITFPAISDKLTTDTVGLSATASSGLPVSFSVFSGPALISDGTNLSFTGTGSVFIVASQTGDASWNAAPDVTNCLTVQHGIPVAGSVTLQRITNQLLKVTTTMLLANTTDPEGSALSVVWVSPASTNGGAVTLSGRWVTYTPPEGSIADDFFQFRVRNAFGGEAVAAAKIETSIQTGRGSQTLNFKAVPAGGNVGLRVFGIPGRAYIVQGATRLIEPDWTNLNGCVIGADGYVDFTETNAPSPRYYRTVKP